MYCISSRSTVATKRFIIYASMHKKNGQLSVRPGVFSYRVNPVQN
jgi:hypothetical protein